MKSVLKHLVFAYISVSFAAAHFTGLDLGVDDLKSKILLSLGLGAIFLIIPTIMKLMSLPEGGPVYFLFSYLVCVGSIFTIDWFLEEISHQTGFLTDLNVLNIVLQSYTLPGKWSLIVTSLLITFAINSLLWLSSSKK